MNNIIKIYDKLVNFSLNKDKNVLKSKLEIDKSFIFITLLKRGSS